VRLPPCVKRFIEEGPEGSGWQFALRFVKAYDPGLRELADEIGDEELAHEIITEARKVDGAFSCFAVATTRPDACDMSSCPLFHEDPVNFLLSYTTHIVYNHITKELKMYFYNRSEPLIIPIRSIAADRRSVLGDIAAFSLEYFEVPIILRVIQQEDGTRIDQLEVLITEAYKKATHVREDDMGVGELLSELYNSYPPTDFKDDSGVVPEALIYVDRTGKYYAVLTRIFRHKARSMLNISSIRKLNEVLKRFGIEARRLTFKYRRAYYYLVPEAVFTELVGESLEERKPVELTEELATIADDWSYLSDEGGE